VILNLEHLPIKVLLPKNKAAIFDDEHQLTPFNDEIISALSQLGLFLMKEGRREPSIVAAGYWLRKKQLVILKSQYSNKKRLAKGVAFHIAPGNVDTLFFYSLIISVLCGNQTVLRISNKLSDETRFFIDLLVSFFETHTDFLAVQSLMSIIQYDHSQESGLEITQQLSLFADARVIWGGDKAVKDICKVPSKATACDITFPDRYSVAIVQISDEQQLEQAVNNLLTDIKPFNQQACSSPKILYWLKTAQELQDKFWLLIAKKLDEQVVLEPTELISQLVYLQRIPLLLNEENRAGVSVKKYGTLQQVDIKSPNLEIIKSHCGLWVLLSQQIDKLDEVKLFNHCQTVTVSGIDESNWQEWQKSTKQPLKRIVLAGQALSFSHVWDGVDLVKNLSDIC